MKRFYNKTHFKVQKNATEMFVLNMIVDVTDESRQVVLKS